MEPIFRRTYTLTDLHVDRFGRLRPSAMAYLAQDVAGGHCMGLGLDWETLASRDMFWAIIRQRFSVTRLPRRGETITLETWPMPTTRAAFPRATVAYDAEGKELFRILGLWVLMNPKTRSMILPAKSGINLDGIVRGTELTPPGSILPKDFEAHLTRTVVFAELDRNGHMNNTKYLDWVMDLQPAQFHEAHPVREILICYHAEALENQQIDLTWNLNEEGLFQVDGSRTKTDVPDRQERVFSAQIRF